MHIGNIEIVDLLSGAYGADVELYADGFMPPLTIAIKHPQHIMRPLVNLLLRRSPSFAQSVKDSVRNAFYFALSRGATVFDLFAKHDPQGFFQAATAVRYNFLTYDTALTSAIYNGMEAAAMQLVSLDVPVETTIDSETIIMAQYGNVTPEEAQKKFWQPILLAAVREMPELIRELLNRGANPASPLPPQVDQEYEDCNTVLDIVRKKLVEMRRWSKDGEPKGFILPGRVDTNEERLQRKADALAAMIEAFESIEADLIKRGVKPSEQLDLEELRLQLETKSKKRRMIGVSSEKSDQSDALGGPLTEDLHSLDIGKLETMEDGHKAL